MCPHDEGTWLNNASERICTEIEGNDREHTIQYKYWNPVICNRCDQEIDRVNEEYGDSWTENHNYNANGVCEDCGHVNGCDHNGKDTYTEEYIENERYEPVDGKTHMRYYDLYVGTFCEGCHVQLDEGKYLEARQDAPSDHSWADGVCQDCNYVCAHSEYRETSWFEYTFSEFVSQNNREHFVTTGTRVTDKYCLACNMMIEETREENASGNEPHRYDENGHCDQCGHDNACEHPSRDTVAWQENWRWDEHYEEQEDGTHKYLFRVDRAKICPDCGVTLASENGDELQEIVEEHTLASEGYCTKCSYQCDHAFEDGVCTKCHYVCDHELDREGHCWRCDYQCEHDYQNGICVICGHKAITVSLNCPYVTMEIGDQLFPGVTIEPAEAQETAVLTWTSNNPAVAAVSANGTVTAMAPGKAIITVSVANGNSDSCEVTAVQSPKSVEFDKQSETLVIGDTLTLTATIAPATANINTGLTWTSSDTGVATVSNSGMVKAIAKGTATITVTTENGKSATCNVTVKQPPVSVELDKNNETLSIGDTLALTAMIKPTTADVYIGLTWTSSDTGVATVSNSGVVKAIAKGTATITVTTENGKSATCDVTVKQPPVSVTLSKTSTTLLAGKSLTLTATIAPATADVDTELTWTSDHPDVATVSSKGVVKAISEGIATITVKTANGKTATCAVTVPEAPTKVTLSSTKQTLVVGASVTLKATLTASTAKTNLTWTSSNTGVATVSSSGVVKAIAKGTAKITVKTANGKTATCTVTVPEAPTKVAFSKTSYSVAKGKTVTLSTVLTPGTAKTNLTWSSSNTKIATVTSAGVVKGIAAGTVTITVKTANGKKATVKVVVK